MKTAIRFLLTLSLFCNVPFPASAEVHIGTVDVKKVLADYGPAKAAEREMKTLADGIKRELDERAAKQKALEGEVRGLNQDLQRPEISAAKKAGLSQALEKKSGELQQATAELRAMAKEQDVNFGNQRQRISEAILKEIKKVVGEIAMSKGYDLVFDTSGSINGRPVVDHANPSFDFTKDVLVKLNEGHPNSESGEKPAISKAPVKSAEADKKR